MLGLPIALGNALKKIRHALERNDLLPIVGPALGSPPLPDTRAVVDAIAAGTYVELQGEIKAALDRNDLAAAMLAIETRGRGISDAVERTYGNPRVACPDVFSALAALPVAHFATFGQDPWLKRALGERPGAPPRVVQANEPSVLAALSPASGPTLVMLHGDAERRGSCVLSRYGYPRLSVSSYGGVLRPLVGGRRLLLLGFGSDDPHLGALLDDLSAIAPEEDVSHHSAPRHFFLGTWISKTDRTRLARHGVRAIEVPPGFKLAMVLRRLAPEVIPETTRKKTATSCDAEPAVVRGELEAALRSAESALERSEEERVTLEAQLRARDVEVWRLEQRAEELEAKVRDFERALAAGNPGLGGGRG